VHNLRKEVDAAADEARAMQRRWLVLQTELVALQVCGTVGDAATLGLAAFLRFGVHGLFGLPL
jgi:hypothetical protein